jgi:hypothetical protein
VTPKAWVQGGNQFDSTGVLGTLDSNHLDLFTSGARRARLTDTGNFIIGDTVDNGQRLQVNGTSYFNGLQYVTGTFNCPQAAAFSTFNPTINTAVGDGYYAYGLRLIPTFNVNGNSQTTTVLDISPTYNMGSYTPSGDAIPGALHVQSSQSGIWIDQTSSFTGNTGQPLVIRQFETSDKEAILNYRTYNATTHPFIWNFDARPDTTSGMIIPALRSSIGSNTTVRAGAGISFVLDRYYYLNEASIDMHYETTPDMNANVNTSIAFNTHSSTLGAITPLYLNGPNVGMGTTTPTAQLHTTGSVRFAGLTQDSTQNLVIVSDDSGNLYYRSAASLAADGLVRSSLAVNGSIKAKRLIVSPDEWADYVFDSSYRLPSLAEVEAYTRKEHHLPGIPSAAEVQKDSLDVGAGQAALLKKIEELTLYNISQEKQIAEQNHRLESQDKTLASLKAEVEELKALITKNK